MASVFKEAAPNLQGVFSSQKAGITAGGTVDLGVVSQVQINYSQNVSRIFDLNRAGIGGGGKVPMYYVGGRSEGRATLGRIVGPKGSGCGFYTNYGDLCNIQPNLQLTFKGSGASIVGCKGKSTKYTMTRPLAISIGISQNAQDTIINENVQFMFADLECK